MRDDVADNVAIERSLTDPDWFDQIYRRYRSDVFSFVVRRVDRSDAPDVTADAFGRAFQARSRYDLSRDNARPWLFGVARRTIGDYRRRRWVRRTRSAGIAATWLDTDIDLADEAARVVDAQHVREELLAALMKLPRRDREPLLMVALDDLSYPEIAEILDIPVGTVRSRIHRARGLLRELLPGVVRSMGEGSES
jgi:RNA polymerase sigma factor (sigma-70 family)